MRAFLEEAAGISKYKERRKETEPRIRAHARESRAPAGPARRGRQADPPPAEPGAGRRAATRRSRPSSARSRRAARAAPARRLRTEVAEQERVLREKRLALEAAIAAQRSAEASIEKLRVDSPTQRALQRRAGPLLPGRRRDRAARAVISAPRGLIQRQTRGSAEHATRRSPRSTRTSRATRSSSTQLEQRARASSSRASSRRTPFSAARSRRSTHAERRDGAWRAALGAASRGARGRRALDSGRGHAASSSSQPRASGSRRNSRGTRTNAQALSFAERRAAARTCSVANEDRLAQPCENAARALETVWRRFSSCASKRRQVSPHLDQLREQPAERSRTAHVARGVARRPRSASRPSKSIAGSQAQTLARAAPRWHKSSWSRPAGNARSRPCSARICKPSASRASMRSPTSLPDADGRRVVASRSRSDAAAALSVAIRCSRM